MSATSDRLSKALLTLAVWIGATVAIGAFQRHRASATLDQIVTALASAPALNVLAGLVVLAGATRAFGWRDLGFGAPARRPLFRLMWFPLLTLAPFPLMALAIGLPPGGVILFLALNTALIALSEEWMFRGILFRALLARLRLWQAVMATSVGFGAVHVLNAFALGNLGLALVQSLAAMMTGTLLVALVLRTGSIWPAVAYHMLWNFGILLLAYETTQHLQPQTTQPLSAYLVPILIVLPNFLFALILLRRLPDPGGGEGRQGS